MRPERHSPTPAGPTSAGSERLSVGMIDWLGSLGGSFRLRDEGKRFVAVFFLVPKRTGVPFFPPPLCFFLGDIAGEPVGVGDPGL